MKCECCKKPDGSSDGVGMILCDDCYNVGYGIVTESPDDTVKKGDQVIVPKGLVAKIMNVFS